MNIRTIPGIIWSLIEARPWRWLMLVLVILEIALISNIKTIGIERGEWGWYWSPVVFTAIALAIGLIPLLVAVFSKNDHHDAHLPGNQTLRFALVAIIFISGSLYTLDWSRDLWREHPVAVSESDVLPSVQLFAQRAMGGADGQPVYAAYDGFGYRLDPTYLPFQWLPFVVTEKLGLDPRWMPILIWIGGLAFFMYYLARSKLSIIWTLGIALIPFWILELIKNDQPQMLYLTIELMDVGYYLFLAWALVKGNIWAKGWGFILTVMSRFSLIFWAPFYFLGLFFGKSKGYAIRLGLIVLAGVVLIYIIPFLSKDWESFQRGQGHYTRAAIGAWSTSWDDNPIPSDLRHGQGLAIHFFKGDAEPLEAQINHLRKLHLVLSACTALLLGLGYLFWYRKIMDPGYYFLFALKVYFAVFYGFIQVPYTYLYQVPVFLSVFILVAAGGGKLLRK
ncbi:MAG: hypothetical protein R3B47_09800 [Bacteroidia bacterium]